MQVKIVRHGHFTVHSSTGFVIPHKLTLFRLLPEAGSDVGQNYEGVNKHSRCIYQ